MEIFKMVITPDDLDGSGNYKSGHEPKTISLQKGDGVYIRSDVPVNVGDHWTNNAGEEMKGLVITKIYYAPKKWWQFWKRKKQVGYRVECV